jgi:hypothetical protein
MYTYNKHGAVRNGDKVKVSNCEGKRQLLLLLLSLAPQPIVRLGLLLKIWLNFLEASQKFSFLQGRVFSPTPNPHPGGPGLCIYIPQRQGGYPVGENYQNGPKRNIMCGS